MSFIRLDRKLLTWGWKDEPNMVALWVELLLQANRFENEWHGEKYEVGTFPTSLQKLSVGTGLSIQKVRTCLDKLKSTNEIAITSTNKGMKICVVKYAQYQGLDETTNTQSNTPSNTPTNTQLTRQLTTLKERKERKKENIYILYGEYQNVKLTNEQLEKLQNEFPNDWLERIERVSVYCQSTGKKYKDYLATIRNWARKDSPNDSLPTYSTTNNKKLSSSELEELLKLRRK